MNVDAFPRLACCLGALFVTMTLPLDSVATGVAAGSGERVVPVKSVKSVKSVNAGQQRRGEATVQRKARSQPAARRAPAVAPSRAGPASGGRTGPAAAQPARALSLAQATPSPRAPRPSLPVTPRAAVPLATADAATGLDQLQALAREAADRSASLREAMAAARAAASDIREAQGARLPQLSLDVTSRQTSGGGVSRTAEARGSPYYAVTGSVPIYDWGRIANIVDSRSASWRAAGARLDGALEALTLETAVAALEVGRARAGVAAADLYLGNMQRLVDMLVAITREDPGRAGELTQARSRVLQAQVNRDALASRLLEAGIALERLAGTPPLPVDAIAEVFAEVPPLARLLEDASEQPLLRQLEAEQQAQAKLADALRSARRPQVGLLASHAPVSPGLAGGYASYAGVTISVPLYRGSSDVAAQRAAAERAEGAGARREQTVVDLSSRIRTLHQSATTLLARETEFVRLLRESDTVRRGFFDQWHEMGRRSLFELLAVENEHYSLEAARLNTRYDGLVASARLGGESGTLVRRLGLRE